MFHSEFEQRIPRRREYSLVDHLGEMNRKISSLRESGSVVELARRREGHRTRYPASRLALFDGVELSDIYPAGLRALYRCSSHPSFGDIVFYRQGDFRAQEPVDFEGEPVGDGNYVQVGAVDEQSILLDMETGKVGIFDFLYFRHGMEDGFMVECADAPEFVNTVALGPRYREIYGPAEVQARPWWDEDPWFEYLIEIGMIARG